MNIKQLSFVNVLSKSEMHVLHFCTKMCRIQRENLKWFIFRSIFSVLASVLPVSCETMIQLLQDISAVTVAVVNLEYDGSILPVKVRLTSEHTQTTF